MDARVGLPSRDRPASDDCHVALRFAVQAASRGIDGLERTELAGPAAVPDILDRYGDRPVRTGCLRREGRKRAGGDQDFP
jgi:hypothetical protein